MCGIVGFYCSRLGEEERREQVGGFVRALAHRGPDAFGSWLCPDTAITFGHTRLAVIDLSQEGAQPMHSGSGRYTIVYNGEVYNYRELRAELERSGVRFRGECDTEVILEAIELWGLKAALRRFVGMFAFALWDRERHELSLARDRLGIKPLYYGWNQNSFYFSSELKPFLRARIFQRIIDRGALCLYMRFNYIPEPWSILENFYKLPPGSYLTISAKDLSSPPTSFSPFADEGHIESFWSLAAEIDARRTSRQSLHHEEQLQEGLLEVLKKSVSRRMISDVPLGAFLSGGVDSSLVVALMQEMSTSPVRTFSIGFHESAFNEAHFAKAVAQHLGTSHTELYVSATDALSVVPSLASMFDEPFADSSQIPTFLVSKLAREQVTVSLSGDGGDELFGGYSRYETALLAWKVASMFPKISRGPLSALIRIVPRSAWKGVFSALMPFMPKKFRVSRPEDRIYRLADVLNYNEFSKLYLAAMSHRPDPETLVLMSKEPATVYSREDTWPEDLSKGERMMFLDTLSYLPGDILSKVDRASMAVALEARVPLLDHEVVEFAWSLPAKFRMGEHHSKYLLRKILYQYVPQELIDRPKMGFAIPFGQWLRSELREWASDLLRPKRLTEAGYLNADEVTRLWSAHLGGARDYQYQLWDVLMFESWREEFGL